MESIEVYKTVNLYIKYGYFKAPLQSVTNEFELIRQIHAEFSAMPTELAQQALDTVKKAMADVNLCNKKFACLILACLAHHNLNEVRTVVLDALPRVLAKEHHLHTFMSAFFKIDKISPISFDIQTLLAKWYAKFTAVQLADMISLISGEYVMHKVFLSMANMKGLTEDSDTLNIWMINKWSLSPAALDRFNTKNKWNESPSSLRFFSLCKLRECQPTDHDFIRTIAIPNLRMGHIPNHLYNVEVLWYAIVTKLRYNELLDFLDIFLKMTSLNAMSPLFVLYTALLNNHDAIRMQNIHPAEIFLATCRFSMGNVHANVQYALEAALFNLPADGFQIHITMDLHERAIYRE